VRALALLLALAACTPKIQPRSVLDEYLTAERSGRYAEAHALLTSTDRAARPLEAYTLDHERAGSIWLAVAKRTTFQYGAVQEKDGHVEIPVKATHPDAHEVEQVLHQVPMRDVTGAPDPTGAVRQWVDEVLDRTAVTATSERILYALREEDGRWRVWLALDRQDAAVLAAARARAAEARGDTTAAAAHWREVLDVPPDPAGVVATFQDEARRALGQAPAPQ
jgi:hypothetical protein